MTRYAVVVCGSRRFNIREEVQYRMLKYPVDTLFIHGNADGADSLCREICDEFGLEEVRVPYFSRFGKAGGPMRNEVMIEILRGLRLIGYIVAVEAFPLPGSRGTQDTMRRAVKNNVPLWVYGADSRDNPIPKKG